MLDGHLNLILRRHKEVRKPERTTGRRLAVNGQCAYVAAFSHLDLQLDVSLGIIVEAELHPFTDIAFCCYNMLLPLSNELPGFEPRGAISPAAGGIDQPAGVILFDPICNAPGVKLPPPFVEGHPHND